LGVFQYGDREVQYLQAKDRQLARAMEQIGHIEREAHPGLFAALVQSIVGQQISTKAQRTIWRRMTEALGEITPQTISACAEEQLQGYGISFRKAGYIRRAGEKVLDGSLDLDALYALPDAEVCRTLSRLDGVGVWTAEMLMLFSMQRPDILSYGDLAILRGMRMLYHHRSIPRPLFEKYRRRYSPYGSVASLYLWAIAGGAIEGMKDYAPKAVKKK
jgi:3-methyladenine DNA glycosylase/8-oxoguanine DNA glycosylase